jgi:hypothetical protein
MFLVSKKLSPVKGQPPNTYFCVRSKLLLRGKQVKKENNTQRIVFDHVRSVLVKKLKKLILH